MAAPMSFFPRMIVVGGTTFIAVVAGAIYIYYKSRHIFDDKTSDDDESCKNNVSQKQNPTDEPGHRKEDSRSDSSGIDPETADSTTINLIRLLECEQDDSQLCQILTTLANQAAFTQGQNAVRLAGGLPVIVKQLERKGESVRTSAASCVANLSLNNLNQPILKACSPTLLRLSSDQNHSDDLRLASIQALVNLSVSGQCGDSFGPLALHSLFELLGDGSTALGQQALRVLVNLSADGTVSPTLLQYEVPDSFLCLLGPHHTNESLLRTLSFLLNLKRESLAATGTSEGTPDNSFSNYFSQRADELTVATEALMDCGNTDVRQQAGRLLVLLSAP